MSSKLDQSLGDIIDSNKSANRGKSGGRRGGRGGRQSNKSNNSSNNNNNNNKKGESSSSGPVRRDRSSRRSEPYNLRDGGARSTGGQQQWAEQMFVPPIIMPAMPQQGVSTHSTQLQRVVGDTIHISNLDKSVTSDDLSDIFKPIGTIKSVNLHYDQNGSSIGTATITFQRKPDASKAVDEFDGAEVDGRVMNIKLVGEVITGPGVTKRGKAAVDALAQFPVVPPQLLSQFAAFHASQAGDLGGRQLSAQGRTAQQSNQPSSRQASNNNNRDSNRSSSQSSRGRGGAKRGGGNSRGGRGGDRGGSRSGGRSKDNADVSAQDLDADLDSYHSKKSSNKTDSGEAASAGKEEAAE